MPQLTPFYFVNQITFIFLLALVVLYILSKYILPKFVALFISRNSVSKF